MLSRVMTPELAIAYEESGPGDGPAVVLLHGWPYSLRSYDAVCGPLARAGFRVIVPELRGFGATSYRDSTVMRTAQQAALGKDVVELLDALGIESAVLAGYDWGARAACVAAALWPERVRGLVTMRGYAIVDVAKEATTPPKSMEAVRNDWYRWVMQIALGETMLETMREEFTRACWQTFSPKWAFTEEQFQAQATSFHNPDWVATTIQQYRWWYGLAEASPRLAELEQRLADKPVIAAPTIVLLGNSDAMQPVGETDGQERQYSGWHERRVLAGAGHCPPMEAPEAVVTAVKDVAGMATR